MAEKPDRKSATVDQSRMIGTNGQMREAFRKLVDTYVPSDRKTYNLLICAIGLSLSILNFGFFVINIVHYIDESMRAYDYAYAVIALFCAYELYYGLNKELQKKFFFWIMLKCIEIPLLFVGFVAFLVHERDFQFQIIVMIFAFVIHIWLLLYIIQRAKSAKNIPMIPDQMYDTPELETKNNLTNVSVY